MLRNHRRRSRLLDHQQPLLAPSGPTPLPQESLHIGFSTMNPHWLFPSSLLNVSCLCVIIFVPSTAVFLCQFFYLASETLHVAVSAMTTSMAMAGGALQPAGRPVPPGASAPHRRPRRLEAAFLATALLSGNRHLTWRPLGLGPVYLPALTGGTDKRQPSGLPTAAPQPSGAR